MAGSEGLVRASRLALAQLINAQEWQRQQAEVIELLKDILVVLNENMQDDRYAIPIMEISAFLIDSYISFIPEESESRFLLLPPPFPQGPFSHLKNFTDDTYLLVYGNCSLPLKRRTSSLQI